MTRTRMASWLVIGVIAACSTPHRATPGGGSADGGVSDAPIDATAGSGDPLAALAALPPACSDSGWCWMVPTPSGTFYSHVTASSPDNIWLTGGGPPGYAAILQWNGTSWIAHRPPVAGCTIGGACTVPYLFPMALATIGPNDAWMVYSNEVVHWDGTHWIVAYVTGSTVTLDGVWEDPTGGAWVTDADGDVLIFHGEAPPQALSTGGYAGAIWGTGTDDVFVTSIDSISHWDGSAFSVVYRGEHTAGSYVGVRGDVWIAGNGILHWDGTAISDVTPADIPEEPWIVGVDYAGSDDVTLLSNGDTGAPSELYHWDGAQIGETEIAPAVTSLGDTMCVELGAATMIAGRLWVVCGDGGVATVTAQGTLQPVVSSFEGGGQFWGTSMSNLYLGDGTYLRHWDGSAWTDLNRREGGLTGVAGAGVGGADELFASHFEFTGSDQSYTTFLDHFDGATWTSVQVTQYPIAGPYEGLGSVRALGPGEVMIVGGNGTAFHFAGGVLTPIATGTAVNLTGIWGPDADHLSITGDGSTLLAWDRANPDVFTVDPSFPVTTDDLGAIAGAGTTTWIAPTSDAYIYRKQGSGAWTTVATPVVPVNIAALADDDVVVTGTDSGSLARWDGSAFSFELYPDWRYMSNLFALPDGTMLVTGFEGIAVHAPPHAPMTTR